jgi:hypothetical protein
MGMLGNSFIAVPVLQQGLGGGLIDSLQTPLSFPIHCHRLQLCEVTDHETFAGIGMSFCSLQQCHLMYVSALRNHPTILRSSLSDAKSPPNE